MKTPFPEAKAPSLHTSRLRASITDTPLVQARNLSKSFGNRTIFEGLNLTFSAHSVTAIVGCSGAGKSTLLNLIGLLEAPSGGELLINGQPAPPVASHSAAMLRRNTINYLFQSNALVSGKSVMDNILLALHYTKLPKNEKRKQIQRILNDLGLSDSGDACVNVLSGGEQQRVAIARCILKPGNLILADEPTGSLDKALASNVFGQVLSMRDTYGKTVIVVTHDPEIAARCDRVITLSKAMSTQA